MQKREAVSPGSGLAASAGAELSPLHWGVEKGGGKPRKAQPGIPSGRAGEYLASPHPTRVSTHQVHRSR